jgi:adenylate kinase
MIIVLIGLPGSGKGTQGRLLAKKLNLSHISIGDMLRQMIEVQSQEGFLIKECIAQGKLVPSDLVNSIVKDFLSQEQYKNGYVLDGYPRNLEQAHFLMEFANHPIKVLFFDIDEQVIIERIRGRFNCGNCGQIYNQYSIKPKIKGVCDICGINNFIYRNDDDDEQTIKKRIQEYKIETYPLIDYYKNNAGFYIIEASKNKKEVELFLDKMLEII